MHLFYIPDLSSTAEVLVLPEEESKHCCKVLRLAIDDNIVLVDGRGGWYTAKILDSHPKRTQVKISNVLHDFHKRNHYLHIAIAPTKNIDRMEWFLEKATEMGIDEITPIICDHSERRTLKIDRLNKRITAAMKQSLKAYHPILNEATAFKGFMTRVFDGQKFIAHCVEGEKVYLKEELRRESSCIILIGPEGDFSSTEIDLAIENGYHPMSLGEARLRTETAALAACFEVNYLNR